MKNTSILRKANFFPILKNLIVKPGPQHLISFPSAFAEGFFMNIPFNIFFDSCPKYNPLGCIKIIN